MAEGSEVNEDVCKILELPDCVLTLLLSYLDTTSLYQLTRTCQFLKSFVEIPLFWRYIDARREPNTNEKVQYCVDRIHEKTTHVFFKAKSRNCGQVPPDFFVTINPFTNLKILVLENQRFSGSKISMKDFPTGLEELSLKKTDIKRAEHFFQRSDKTMRKLKVLILDGCKWVTSSFFLSVAKYENLEIVSAVKCLRLHLDMVPYLSVARFHCKKLKLFDCRFTGIGHELLRYFYSKEVLQGLYFQSLKSSELDYDKKIFNGSYMCTLTYPTEVNRMDSIISDDSLIEYVHCIASKSVEPMPSSFLYSDPYPSCTCNYRGQDSNSKVPKITEDYYLSESLRHQLMKFVCQRHFAEVQKLPNEFKEFFVANQKQFYTDMNSDVESDSDSSGSESDSSCCMYGMGRKMIVLTPGNNRELREEILELNRDNRRDRPNNFNIFIRPLGENRNSAEPDRAVASTSRSVSENSVNENIENARNEAKRRHGDDPDDTPKGKKRKTDEADGSDQLNDEMHAAEVDALVESAVDMGNRLNNFIESSLSNLNGRPARFSRQNGPSTSRAEENNQANSNSLGQPQENHNNSNVASPAELRTFRREPQERNPTNEGNSGTPERSSSSRQGSPYGPLLVVNEVEINREGRISGPIHPLDMFARVGHACGAARHEAAMKKLSLNRLSLRGFRRVTDVGLSYIKNLNIDLLDLTYTSVTEQGIESFLINNPNCRIVHPLYCVCKPISPFD